MVVSLQTHIWVTRQQWLNSEFTQNTEKRVLMMPTLLSLAAQEVVIKTTPCASSDNKVDKMSTISNQWVIIRERAHLHYRATMTQVDNWVSCHNFRVASVYSKTKVVIMAAVSSLAAPDVVVMTTFSAAKNDKVLIITSLGFQWWYYCRIDNFCIFACFENLLN